MEKIIQNCLLEDFNTFTPTNFRLKISDTGLVQKYQCPKMSENFNSVVNFIIYKKLKNLKILENKNTKLQSFDHSKQGKQTPVWIFFKV